MISVAENQPIHERQGSIWEYVSPSRLALFLRCPLAFKLRYVDGIRTPTSPVLFVGKAVHSAFEAFNRHRMLGVTLSADELACRVVSYAWLLRQTTSQLESGLEIRSLIKTKTPRLAIHRYSARTEKHFRRLFAVLREYRAAIDTGRFSFRPGWGCNLCEFRETNCRHWTG